MRKQGHTFCKNVDGGYELSCSHCGEVVKMLVPMALSTFVEMMKGFGRAHKQCVKGNQ